MLKSFGFDGETKEVEATKDIADLDADGDGKVSKKEASKYIEDWFRQISGKEKQSEKPTKVKDALPVNLLENNATGSGRRRSGGAWSDKRRGKNRRQKKWVAKMA